MIPRATRRWTLSELAQSLDANWRGDGNQVIERVGDLKTAGPEGLAAVYDNQRLSEARDSNVGVLVAAAELEETFGARSLLLSPCPKSLFARAAALIHPRQELQPGVHPTAVVSPGASIGEQVDIGAYAVIGDKCRVGARTLIGAGAVLLEGVEVGEDAEIHPRVVLYPRTQVGDRTILYAGAVVGAAGFGHAKDEDGRVVRVPHVGRVVLGDDVEIGANSTVDRATFGETRLEDRVRIDNLVQVGHNARLGSDTMVAAQSGLSGSSSLGRGVLMGGQSGLADHVQVGDGSIVAAKSAVFQDVDSGGAVAGIPAMPISAWRRVCAVYARLPQLWSDLRRLQKKIEEE